MTRGVKMLVVGIALVIAGVILDGAGVMLWSTVDSDGRIVVPVGVVDAGQARTLVVDIDRYAAAPPGLQSLGRTRLSVIAREKVFLAVGSTPDVDGALRGSTYVAANGAGSGWQVAEVPGQADLGGGRRGLRQGPVPQAGDRTGDDGGQPAPQGCGPRACHRAAR